MKLSMCLVATGFVLAGCERAAETPVSGAELYVDNCAACHGDRGEGDGPVAASLTVEVPNLRTLRERSNGTFPADDVAAYVDGRSTAPAHGARLMPIWGDEFAANASDEREVQRKISALVEFIAELQY
jgi:mono/diheme cytochrome c family protein